MSDNRRMCPHCRAFITSSDRKCPYCGEHVGARSIQLREPADVVGGLIPQAHFTTVLILLINVGLYIATTWIARDIGEGPALWAFGGKLGRSIWRDHEWWRIITAGFLHGGLLHIGMNSWVLYDLGAQVEQVYGTARFLVIYFLATAGGFLLSAYLNPGLSIGSSAGITGLLGAMIAFGVANRSSVGKAIRNFYVRWVVYILAIGLIPGFSIDNWAHIGGLAAGFVVAYVSGTPIRSTHTRETVWRGIAGLCIAITVVCFWQVYTHFPTPEQFNQLR